MLKQLHKHLVNELWTRYLPTQPFAPDFFRDYPAFILEHFAIIDPMPSSYSGINYNAKIFAELGFITAGKGFLSEKNNDFSWMRADEGEMAISQFIPQVVLADFRAENVSRETFCIIDSCVKQCLPFNFARLKELKKRYLTTGDSEALSEITAMVIKHFHQRPWSPITVKQYKQVAEENQLLAWTLVFGRRINHFGILVERLDDFLCLEEFNDYISKFVCLNKHGGDMIKGGKEKGIAQSATVGVAIDMQLADGIITIQQPFMEFVWRYPKSKALECFNDYTFQGYLAANANTIIESLYDKVGAL
jgi:hypothetical protein